MESTIPQNPNFGTSQQNTPSSRAMHEVPLEFIFKPSKIRLFGITIALFGVSIFFLVMLIFNLDRESSVFSKWVISILSVYWIGLGFYYLFFTALTIRITSMEFEVKRLWPPYSVTYSISNIKIIHLRWNTSWEKILKFKPLDSVSLQLENGLKYHFVTFYLSQETTERLIRYFRHNFDQKLVETYVRHI